MTSCLDHGTPGEMINNSIRCINAPSALGKTYMDSLNMQSGLHVVANVKVARAYQDNAEFGLFALFVTAAFRHSLQTWTSDFFKQPMHALFSLSWVGTRSSQSDPEERRLEMLSSCGAAKDWRETIARSGVIRFGRCSVHHRCRQSRRCSTSLRRFEVSAHQVNCQPPRAVLPPIGGVLCPKLALALGMSAPAQNEPTMSLGAG
ncbi:hypothetical protein PI124_g11556 [Phytophthora idaei]|nr:hypothetical protein PI124_g11556 [Phytophthora idaei]